MLFEVLFSGVTVNSLTIEARSFVVDSSNDLYFEDADGKDVGCILEGSGWYAVRQAELLSKKGE